MAFVAFFFPKINTIASKQSYWCMPKINTIASSNRIDT